MGAHMRILRHVFLLHVAILVTLGCGNRPEPPAVRGQENPLRPRSTPTPYPTRTAPSRGFDASTLKPEYEINYSGPSWVQLNNRRIQNNVIVVGIVQSEPGGNYDRQVELHRQEFSNNPLSKYRESGTIETRNLGLATWSWASFDADGVEMEQLALFAEHPTEGCLLVARSEFPSDGGNIEPRLRELVEVAEIVGPGL